MENDTDTWSARIVALLCTGALVCLFAIMGSFDYANQLELEAEAKLERAQRASYGIAVNTARRARTTAQSCQRQLKKRTDHIVHVANGGALAFGDDLIVRCYQIAVQR